MPRTERIFGPLESYQRVFQLRAEGLTEREVASRVGYGRSTIRRWLAGQSSPRDHNSGLPQELIKGPHLAFLIGALLGDGSFTPLKRKNWVRFSSVDIEFTEAVARALNLSVLKESPVTVKRKVRDRGRKELSISYHISTRSSRLCNILSSGSWRDYVIDYPLDFLRGFADAEGSFSKRLTIYNKDWELLAYIQELVSPYGLRFRLSYCKGHWAGVHRLHLGTREQYKLYASLVGSTIYRKQKVLATKEVVV